MFRFKSLKNTKKGISPVVATSLLLVVAVSSVVFFQGWFNDFSSSVLVDIESDSSSSSSAVRVEGVVNDNLYLKTLNDASLDLLVVKDDLGNEICSFNKNNVSVSNDSLTGYWKFDNTNNGVITDYSGNSNDGKLYGNSRLLLDFENFNGTHINDLTAYDLNLSIGNNTNYSYDCGLSGNCLSFLEGNTAGTRILDNSAIDFDTNSLTVSSWFKLNKNLSEHSNTYPVLFLNRDFPDSGYGIHFVNHSSKVLFQVCGGVCQPVLSSSILGSGEWVNVVGVLDENYLKIYINGVLDNTTVRTVNLSPSNTSMDFGGNLDGSIDEVAIYSKALSDDEVKKLYNSKKVEFIEFVDGDLEFDGIDDYVEIENSLNLGFFGNFSVYSKFNPYSGQDFNQHGTSSVYRIRTYGFGLSIKSNDTLFSFYYSNNSGDNSGHNKFWLNNFNYNSYINSVMFVNDSDFCNAFGGGVTCYNKTFGDGAYFDDGRGLVLGYDGGSSTPKGYFKGIFSELRTFNRSLSNEEAEFLSSPDLDLSGGNLNKIDLSGCNLQKGKKYDVLTGSNDGLNEVSVVIK